MRRAPPVFLAGVFVAWIEKRYNKAVKIVLVIASLFATLLLAPAADAYLQETQPLLPERVSLQFKRDVAAAPKSNVFSKVGDSNSEMLQNFYSIGCRSVSLGNYQWLRSTVKRYKQKALRGSSPCNAKNSFSHISASARSGAPSALFTSPTTASTTGFFWRDPLCFIGEAYLDCELRLVRPKYTFITAGTNDAAWGLSPAQTKEKLAAVLARVRGLRSAPVLTTITPITLPYFEGNVGAINDQIIALASETGAPLVNNWRATATLKDKGLYDGLHLSYYGTNPLQTTADFSAEGLHYGANTRNLLFLRALAKLDALTG